MISRAVKSEANFASCATVFNSSTGIVPPKEEAFPLLRVRLGLPLRLPMHLPAGQSLMVHRPPRTTCHSDLIPFPPQFLMKTEVILTHNIVGLGAESDQVKVAAGYARNYLFPQGFAIPLTGANKRRIEALRQRRAEREAHEFNTMSELSKGMSKLLCVIKVKTGEDGKMFGSIT